MLRQSATCLVLLSLVGPAAAQSPVHQEALDLLYRALGSDVPAYTRALLADLSRLELETLESGPCSLAELNDIQQLAEKIGVVAEAAYGAPDRAVEQGVAQLQVNVAEGFVQGEIDRILAETQEISGRLQSLASNGELKQRLEAVGARLKDAEAVLKRDVVQQLRFSVGLVRAKQALEVVEGQLNDRRSPLKIEVFSGRAMETLGKLLKRTGLNGNSRKWWPIKDQTSMTLGGEEGLVFEEAAPQPQ